jgi:general secretion pathway protein A
VVLEDPVNGTAEPFSYNNYYGFSESPFEMFPEVKSIYLTPSHRNVLNSVRAAIDDQRGIVSVTGEPGTGKTTLIRFLLDTLDRKFKNVLILYSSIPYVELLKTILLELHQDIESDSEEGLTSQLHDYLLDALSDHQALLVVVDEAQILHEDVLSKIGRLCLLERKLRIILVGHPDIEKKLRAQRLTPSETRFFIKPLSRRESREYIDHRLRLSGSSIARTFTPRAIFPVIRYAHGIPCVLSTVCDNALLRGFILSKRRIDVEIVHEVIRTLEGPGHLRTTPGRIVRAFERFPPVSWALKLLLGP